MTKTSRDLLTTDEINSEIQARNGWKLVGNKIEKHLKFKDFGAGVDFISRLVEPADELDHHPDIRIVYNQVTLTLFTHDRGGLTALDFELADLIDREIQSK